MVVNAAHRTEQSHKLDHNQRVMIIGCNTHSGSAVPATQARVIHAIGTPIMVFLQFVMVSAERYTCGPPRGVHQR
jgi:hypothetical protein